jgi:hypothetical protein
MLWRSFEEVILGPDGIDTCRQGDEGAEFFDEITTKQTIVLQLFQSLGWNIFSTDEVLPEFAVDERRVDYCLRHGQKSLVFVEVKKPAEDLAKHEEQLLDYSFKQGIRLAVLTNGRTWWFYLPLLSEKWKDRRFFTIDIIEQEAMAIAARFTDLLGKDNVQTGNAVAAAEMIHQNKKKATMIAQTLPDAWNQIVGEPAPILVATLADTTEKICGYKPEPRDVEAFLLTHSVDMLLETLDGPVSPPHRPIAVPQGPQKEKEVAGRGGGPLVVRVGEKHFEGTSIPTLYLSVLKYLVDSGLIKKVPIPWGPGDRRFFIFMGSKPVHQNGKDFFQPVSYLDYHLEGHVNRAQGVKYLGQLCNMCGQDFQIIEQ